MVKNLPAMQETWVQSLGWEDPLEEGRAIHSSILGLENPQAAYGPVVKPERAEKTGNIFNTVICQQNGTE